MYCVFNSTKRQNFGLDQIESNCRRQFKRCFNENFFDRLGKLMGKEENSGYQHFPLFQQCFLKPSSLGSLKSGLCAKELTLNHTITNFERRILKTLWEKKKMVATSISSFSNNVLNPYTWGIDPIKYYVPGKHNVKCESARKV